MVDIRPATPEDIPTVRMLVDALTREDTGQHAEAFDLEWVRREGEAACTRMIDDENRGVYVVEQDGTAVGYVSG